MTKLVEILEPDGRVTRAEFPDDASDAEIEAALGGLTPQPSTPAPAQPQPSAEKPFPLNYLPNIPDPLQSDLITQGIGSTAGITVGTALGGPLGGMIGGALGSVGGGVISRAARGEDPLSGGDIALDALSGTLGPASTALAKAGLRQFVGLSEEVLEKGIEAANKVAKNVDPKWTFREIFANIDKAAQGEIRDALIKALRTPPSAAFAQRGGEMLALGHMLLQGDPVKSLGILLGGYTLSGVSKAAARKVIQSDTLLHWLTSASKTRASPGDLAGSLAAIVAENRDELAPVMDAVGELMTALLSSSKAQAAERPADPFSGERRRAGMPQRRARDPKTGKFVKGGVDHSALEELFGGGL